MPKSATTIKLDKVADTLAALRFLDENRVMIGIPAANAGRRDEAINNAAIGFIQENGDPEMNLPARPFLVPGVKEINGAAIERLRDAGKAALTGDPKRAERQLNAIGLMGQNAVRKKITDGPFAPLKASTLARRRARGRKGEKPLIDTGQLRAAVTYIIRRIRGR